MAQIQALTDSLKSVVWERSCRLPFTEADLLAEVNTPFDGHKMRDQAARLAGCDPSLIRLITDEGDRLGLIPSPRLVWGVRGEMTVWVYSEQIGGGKRQKSLCGSSSGGGKRTRPAPPPPASMSGEEEEEIDYADDEEDDCEPAASLVDCEPAAPLPAAPAPAAAAAAPAAAGAAAAPAAAAIAADPRVNDLLRIAIRLGIDSRGVEGFRQAMIAAGVEPAQHTAAFQRMQPIVAAYAESLPRDDKAGRAFKEKAKLAADLLSVPPPNFLVRGPPSHTYSPVSPCPRPLDA